MFVLCAQHLLCCSYAGPTANQIKGFDCVHVPGVIIFEFFCRFRNWENVVCISRQALTADSTPVPRQSFGCGNQNGFPGQTTCCEYALVIRYCTFLWYFF